jgi:hypothetical protein
MKALTFSPPTLTVSYLPVDLPIAAPPRGKHCFTVSIVGKENFICVVS